MSHGRAKPARNQAHDRLVTRTLCKAGWQVVRIWEHELAGKREGRLFKRIQKALNSSPRPSPRARWRGRRPCGVLTRRRQLDWRPDK